MLSFKGLGFKIVAALVALAALGFGIYSTFFMSAGYETTKATIVSIEEDPNYVPDPDTNDKKFITTVKYTVDGKEYVNELDSYDPSYKVGGEVEVRYDPKDPSKITSGFGFGIYLIIAGGVILALLIFFTVKDKIAVGNLKAQNGELEYAPSEKGEERELYFLTDMGTVKVGHRLEDKNRKVVYEAKMTKFSPFGACSFEFIDHEKGKTTPHLIGKTEETDWNSLILDNHSTFTIDGKDIWKHLRSVGVTIDSRLGKAEGIMPSYDIRRDGQTLASAENTSQYVHEDDAEQHSVASKVPVLGFYRVVTSEKNLDLLFTVLVAMARSGATDERGGSRRMLFNTIKGE